MKTHDLVVKTGEYEQNGETKARWQNVGAVINTEKGPMLLLEKWFNPAGVVDSTGSDSILIRMMPVDRDRKQSPQLQDVPF